MEVSVLMAMVVASKRDGQNRGGQGQDGEFGDGRHGCCCCGRSDCDLVGKAVVNAECTVGSREFD